MVVVKDWRGTRIKVGDTVVYPSRQSSSLWMNEGEVVSVALDEWTAPKVGVKRTRTTGYGSDKGGRVSYPDPDRMTVIS